MANNPKIAAFLANILYIFGQDVLGKDSEGNTILHMMARKVRIYYSVMPLADGQLGFSPP